MHKSDQGTLRAMGVKRILNYNHLGISGMYGLSFSLDKELQKILNILGRLQLTLSGSTLNILVSTGPIPNILVSYLYPSYVFCKS